MVHELHRLLPTLVLEEDNGPVAFLPEVETYFCADPFLGPIDHLPLHALGGVKLENPDVKAEQDYAADFGFPWRVDRPPAGKDLRAWSMPYRRHPGMTM
jgi:hypothetical protein